VAFGDAAVGGLVGAVVGGFATYVGERKLQRRAAEEQAAVRAQALRDETAASREAQSKAAAIDVLEVLWLLSREVNILRWAAMGRIGNSDLHDRAVLALDRAKHATAVDGPQLSILALREQLAEVSRAVSEFAYGKWAMFAGEDGKPDREAEKIRMNRGAQDIDAYLTWVTTMFEAYVDGSWSQFAFEPRPVLSRESLEVWLPPEERA
jgi:hypothetical protein